MKSFHDHSTRASVKPNADDAEVVSECTDQKEEAGENRNTPPSEQLAPSTSDDKEKSTTWYKVVIGVAIAFVAGLIAAIKRRKNE